MKSVQEYISEGLLQRTRTVVDVIPEEIIAKFRASNLSSEQMRILVSGILKRQGLSPNHRIWLAKADITDSADVTYLYHHVSDHFNIWAPMSNTSKKQGQFREVGPDEKGELLKELWNFLYQECSWKRDIDAHLIKFYYTHFRIFTLPDDRKKMAKGKHGIWTYLDLENGDWTKSSYALIYCDDDSELSQTILDIIRNK